MVDKTRDELLADVREAQAAYDLAFFGEASFEHQQECSIRLARAKEAAATSAEKIMRLHAEATDYLARADALMEQAVSDGKRAMVRAAQGEHDMALTHSKSAIAAYEVAKTLSSSATACWEHISDLLKETEVAAPSVRPG